MINILLKCPKYTTFLSVKIFEGLNVYYNTMYMSSVTNISIYFIILFLFLISCASLPGINESPIKKKANQKLIESQYTINDVRINIININNLSEVDINFYNEKKVEEADYKVKKFSDIYNYK